MNLKNLNVTTKIPKILEDKLKNKRIKQIYKKFDDNLDILENFAVAVSGGPDSLALAFLAKIYSLKNNLKVKFFIVNHNLRNDSTLEALKVQKILKRHSIDTKILIWKGKKPTKNVQSLARKKRYELLFEESDKFKINNVLIGHHQDDLLENFFIRILRGSGLKGLISLDKKSIIGNKVLIRPLINQKKDDLVFVANFVFNFYVEDPSNSNEKFQRIKIRNLISELQKEGLDKKKFNNTIKNLKYSDEVINFYVDQNLKKNTFLIKKKGKLILKNQYFMQPYEVIFRSLSKSIKEIGKKFYPVRGKKLDRIISNIQKDRLSKQTIGGCIIERVSQTIIITKER